MIAKEGHGKRGATVRLVHLREKYLHEDPIKLFFTYPGDGSRTLTYYFRKWVQVIVWLFQTKTNPVSKIF